MQVSIPEEWKDRDVPDATRTQTSMAINPRSDDRLLFCPECGYNVPWGKNMGIMSMRNRFNMHHDSGPNKNDPCTSERAYNVSRVEMEAYWDDAQHLD